MLTFPLLSSVPLLRARYQCYNSCSKANTPTLTVQGTQEVSSISSFNSLTSFSRTWIWLNYELTIRSHPYDISRGYLSTHAKHVQDVCFRQFGFKLFIEYLYGCMSNVIFCRDPAKIGDREGTSLAIECYHASLGQPFCCFCNKLAALGTQSAILGDFVPSQTYEIEALAMKDDELQIQTVLEWIFADPDNQICITKPLNGVVDVRHCTQRYFCIQRINHSSGESVGMKHEPQSKGVKRALTGIQ